MRKIKKIEFWLLAIIVSYFLVIVFIYTNASINQNALWFWLIITVCLVIFAFIFGALLNGFSAHLTAADEYNKAWKQKQKQGSSDKPKSFDEVIIEPSTDIPVHIVVHEMKVLSLFIDTPVCAEYKGKKFRIIPTTDVDYTVYCFYNNIDSDSVKSKQP